MEIIRNKLPVTASQGERMCPEKAFLYFRTEFKHLPIWIWEFRFKKKKKSSENRVSLDVRCEIWHPAFFLMGWEKEVLQQESRAGPHFRVKKCIFKTISRCLQYKAVPLKVTQVMGGCYQAHVWIFPSFRRARTEHAKLRAPWNSFSEWGTL